MRANATPSVDTSTHATSAKHSPPKVKTFSHTEKSAPGPSAMVTSKPTVSDPPTPSVVTSSDPFERPSPVGAPRTFLATKVPPPLPGEYWTTWVAKRLEPLTSGRAAATDVV